MNLPQFDNDESVLFVPPEQFLALMNVVEKARELVKTNPKTDLPINHNESGLELIQALHLLDHHGGVQ
jgi:hypothetical protein